LLGVFVALLMVFVTYGVVLYSSQSLPPQRSSLDSAYVGDFYRDDSTFCFSIY
jgi:hypothetical protein